MELWKKQRRVGRWRIRRSRIVESLYSSTSEYLDLDAESDFSDRNEFHGSALDWRKFPRPFNGGFSHKVKLSQESTLLKHESSPMKTSSPSRPKSQRTSSSSSNKILQNVPQFTTKNEDVMDQLRQRLKDPQPSIPKNIALVPDRHTPDRHTSNRPVARTRATQSTKVIIFQNQNFTKHSGTPSEIASDGQQQFQGKPQITRRLPESICKSQKLFWGEKILSNFDGTIFLASKSNTKSKDDYSVHTKEFFAQFYSFKSR